MDEKGVDVPSYFLCPISLQIMRDPVTLPTGITYDRESIEKWIYSGTSKGDAAATCPVTKQAIPRDAELTPNHTLRRLTQAWCVANASHGVERLPTPRAPLDKAQFAALLDEGKRPGTQVDALRKLRTAVGESERNRRCAEASGVPDFLVSLIRSCRMASVDEEETTTGACEEALGILHSLQLSPHAFCDLVVSNADLVQVLTAALRHSNYQSRAYSTFLLRSLLEAASPVRLLTLDHEFFEGLVNVARDQISCKATRSALRIIALACPWGRNRVKAAEADAVRVLVDLLLDSTEKRLCELALVVLDQLCGCAEGRAELLGHAAGLAVVSKKILRVSHLATERAVRVISSVARYSATPAVLNEMMQVGVVTKLCVLLQVEMENKAKEKAKEVLRMHSKAWRDSPCIPTHLLTSFPARC